MLPPSKPAVDSIVIHRDDSQRPTTTLLTHPSQHYPYNYWTLNDRFKTKNDYLSKRQQCSCRLAFYSLWILISACVLFIIAYRFSDECGELVKKVKCKRYGLFLLSICIASLACSGIFCGACQYFRSQSQQLTAELYYDKANNILKEQNNLNNTRHCCCVYQQEQQPVQQHQNEDEKTPQTTVHNISSISSTTSSSYIQEQQQKSRQQSPKIDQRTSTISSISPLPYYQIQSTSNRKIPPFTYEEISPQIKKVVDKSVSLTSSTKSKMPPYHHTILLSSSSSSSSPHSMCVGINKILMNDIVDDEQYRSNQAQTPSSYTTCVCSPVLIQQSTSLETQIPIVTEQINNEDDIQLNTTDIWQKNENHTLS
ncbi:unnamed protein product [Didymodactylos carnosus]|uniref:Uncharacterized protein n=1 Tax=Didymodactylos carnosus TaxID=1234261 RepID=A0A8S2UB92_9BILA|nr:unnamed protein product [Didymodactylos carnosus]